MFYRWRSQLKSSDAAVCPIFKFINAFNGNTGILVSWRIDAKPQEPDDFRFASCLPSRVLFLTNQLSFSLFSSLTYTAWCKWDDNICRWRWSTIISSARIKSRTESNSSATFPKETTRKSSVHCRFVTHWLTRWGKCWRTRFEWKFWWDFSIDWICNLTGISIVSSRLKDLNCSSKNLCKLSIRLSSTVAPPQASKIQNFMKIILETF